MRLRLLPLQLLPVLLMSISACAGPEPVPDYAAGQTLSPEEQHDLLSEISRHIGRLPRHGTHENKFEARFDDHYARVASDHRIDLAHFDQTTGTLSFLASRIAPSITVKRVGIAVRLRRSENGEIVAYEEVFRTWRMEEPDLAEKGAHLFHKMVSGEDLTLYTPEHSVEEYIEFPNASTRYDLDTRQWISDYQHE
jgi:hypothetical protein